MEIRHCRARLSSRDTNSEKSIIIKVPTGKRISTQTCTLVPLVEALATIHTSIGSRRRKRKKKEKKKEKKEDGSCARDEIMGETVFPRTSGFFSRNTRKDTRVSLLRYLTPPIDRYFHSGCIATPRDRIVK